MEMQIRGGNNRRWREGYTAATKHGATRHERRAPFQQTMPALAHDALCPSATPSYTERTCKAPRNSLGVLLGKLDAAGFAEGFACNLGAHEVDSFGGLLGTR